MSTQLTVKQQLAYRSAISDRLKRYMGKILNLLLDQPGLLGESSGVERVNVTLNGMTDVIDESDGLRWVAEIGIEVVADGVLPVHGHSASPVVAGSEPGRSDAPAVIVQEVGGSPAAQAGVCNCAAPAKSSPGQEGQGDRARVSL